MNKRLALASLAVMIALPGAAQAFAPLSSDGTGISGWALLPLGFAIGMLHALEADHLAAVATMFNDRGGRRSVIIRGAFWGFGHTLSLFLICSTVVLIGVTISTRVEASLELAVGAMIVLLGCQLLWRIRKERAHVHVHEHDGQRHLHLHTHADRVPHKSGAAHRHRHRLRGLATRGNLKAMGIGIVHGAAGSAGLLVLMVASTQSFLQTMIYLVVFGLGSVAGMAAVSAVASLPLALLQRGTVWVRNATSIGIGLAAVWVGGTLALHSAWVFGPMGM